MPLTLGRAMDPAAAPWLGIIVEPAPWGCACPPNIFSYLLCSADRMSSYGDGCCPG